MWGVERRGGGRGVGAGSAFVEETKMGESRGQPTAGFPLCAGNRRIVPAPGRAHEVRAV